MHDDRSRQRRRDGVVAPIEEPRRRSRSNIAHRIDGRRRRGRRDTSVVPGRDRLTSSWLRSSTVVVLSLERGRRRATVGRDGASTPGSSSAVEGGPAAARTAARPSRGRGWSARRARRRRPPAARSDHASGRPTAVGPHVVTPGEAGGCSTVSSGRRGHRARRRGRARRPPRSAVDLARARLDLVPRHRRRHGRLRPGPQRVRGDRRLVVGVLAPVDEDLPRPHGLGHRRRHLLRQLLLEHLADGEGELGACSCVTLRRVQRHVQLQALRPGRLRPALQVDGGEDVARATRSRSSR